LRNTLVKYGWPIATAFLTIIFFGSNYLLLQGKAVGIWDANDQFYPYQALIADYARAGRIVNWSPWSNTGTPLSGDPQAGTFSPLNIIIGYATGGTSYGFILYWLFVWWLGGCGIMLLARHLKVPPWGGCVVALGYLFCGVYTGNAQHLSWLIGFSFLPLIIWRLDAALITRKPLAGVEAGALWGLSALSSYPGLTITTAGFALLWAVGRHFFTETPQAEGNAPALLQPLSTRRIGRSEIGWLALAVIVGVLVLQPSYFTFFYEGAGVISRTSAINREASLFNSLSPGALLSFASPQVPILKLYNRETLWPALDVSMCSIYAGALIPVLALLALAGRPRDRWRWWLVLLAALSLACALGQTLPLRGWLYDWFYPMRFFRHAAIFRLYYLFSIAVLALFATRDLRQAALRRDMGAVWSRFFFIAAWLASCAVLVLVAFDSVGLKAEENAARLGNLHVLAVWGGLCLIAFTGWKLRGDRKTWTLPILLLTLAGGDALMTGVLSRQTMISQSEEFVGRWKQLDEKHSPALALTAAGWRRDEGACYPATPCLNFNNDQLITKTPVLRSYYYATGGDDLLLRTLEHPVLKDTALGGTRVWFARQVGQVRPSQGNFDAFLQRAESLGRPPLVVHAPEEMIGHMAAGELPQAEVINGLNAMEYVRADVVKYDPDELIFRADCETDGWLLLTDRWARSWQAEINGVPSAVYGGNFIFRAVRISTGRNEIKFTYRPAGSPWLLILSWSTLMLVAACSLYANLPWRNFPGRKGKS